MGTSILDIVKEQLSAFQPCLILIVVLVLAVSVIGVIVIRRGTWQSDTFLCYGLLQSITATEMVCVAVIVFRWALVVSCAAVMVDLNAFLLPLVLIACIALGILRRRPLLFAKDTLLCVVQYGMLLLIMLFRSYIASTVINSFLWVILVLFIILEVLFVSYCALLTTRWTFELREGVSVDDFSKSKRKSSKDRTRKARMRFEKRIKKEAVKGQDEEEGAETHTAEVLG